MEKGSREAVPSTNQTAGAPRPHTPPMRMLLVGAGAVGECILKVLKKRDPDAKWLTYVLIADYDSHRAADVARRVQEFGAPGRCRYEHAQADARSVETLTALIEQHQITFVMDAAPPFASNFIFDAAFLGGTDYASMGTWSVPKQHPAFGYGFEGSYEEPMTKYNFDRHEAWRKKGRMACICLGIDPGVVNVLAKYAAEYLFDELWEVHVKDGGNLTLPGASRDTVQFGFNVWTVLDEVLNPNAEWFRDQGFLLEDAFAGQETFSMPHPFGENTLVKVEHEEVVTLPRYLSSYGLRRASFKIALDESLIRALRLLDSLGLRSIEPVTVNGVPVIPRDVVAACAPQPRDIGKDMTGGMCVGVHCIGKKDGQRQEYFLYQPFDNQQSLRDWEMQAVVAQTGFGAALALELIGRGIWQDAGVFSPEYFPSLPYIRLMEEAGLEYRIVKLGHSAAKNSS